MNNDLPSMSMSLDLQQKQAARQFHRQADHYGSDHPLADARDVTGLLAFIPGSAKSGRALDVATGGGHTALALAHAGFTPVIGDLAPAMLENARRLLAANGFSAQSSIFPAEEIPFPRESFDLVSCRVAPHHFSDVPAFVRESHRVLKPGGYLMIIDGSAPDGDPETADWLHRVEKLRDPSHGRLLDRITWTHLVKSAGFILKHCDLQPMLQPDLEWYFQTAATPEANREEVRRLVREASPHVREVMELQTDGGVVRWTWRRISLLAVKCP